MDQAIDLIKVLTTIDKREDAQAIARSLVEKNLAACVQIVGPIQSVYRWEGQVETSDEWLLLIKTSASHLESVETEIGLLHSYATPEIIALPIVAGARDYLDWVHGQLKTGSGDA